VSAGSAPAEPSLARALNEETHALRAFVGLLEDEQRALFDGNADQLLVIAEEKNRASSQLSRLGLSRAHWLSARGFGSGRAAVTTWLNQLAHDSTQRAAWRQLLELASRAHALNQENGALIHSRMQHNQQALAVLLSASGQAMLYGPDGQTFAGPGKRHLGSV
jgi:flagella synthesis protein FlgN